MKALLLINERSGAVLDVGVDAIVEAAKASASIGAARIELEILVGDFKTLCEKATNTDSVDAVLCAGGDGTQAAVASALLYGKTALLPLPCGTVNLFCRDLGLPLDVADAIATGLKAPVKAIDAGRIGDRIFLNNVVFGAYAAIADAREQLRSVEDFDDVSFGFVEAVYALFNANPNNYSVTIDGEEIHQTTNTIVVSNNAVSGAERLIPHRDRLDEGLLYVYLGDAANGAEFAALLADFARGEASASERISVRTCRACRISSTAESFSYTVDGDPVEAAGPVDMEIAQAALNVFYPSARRSKSIAP